MGAWETGLEHYGAERYREAAAAFREATRNDPTDARAWRDLGVTLALLDQRTDAEECLFTAVALAPSDAPSWYHLGKLRSERGDDEGALQAFRKSLERVSDDPNTWLQTSHTLARLGQVAEAREAYERARRLPGGPRREWSKTNSHLPASRPRDPAAEARSWVNLARGLLTLGAKEDAIAAYWRGSSVNAQVARRSGFLTLLREFEEGAPGLPSATPTASWLRSSPGEERPLRRKGPVPPEPTFP
jgi:tetratricopeptide (TPR) repeat protein